jgi:hypothetical protein
MLSAFQSIRKMSLEFITEWVLEHVLRQVSRPHLAFCAFARVPGNGSKARAWAGGQFHPGWQNCDFTQGQKGIVTRLVQSVTTSAPAHRVGLRHGFFIQLGLRFATAHHQGIKR